MFIFTLFMAKVKAKKVIPRKQKKYRLTKQRAAILKYLQGVKTHPSAQSVFKALLKSFPQISFGTVYRNLNFLQEHGYCKEFVLGKVSRFDGRVDSHIHLICDQCLSIVDLDDKKSVIQLKKLAGRERFHYRFGNFEIHGFCAACMKKMIAQGDIFCEACGDPLHQLTKQEEKVRQECLFLKEGEYIK